MANTFKQNTLKTGKKCKNKPQWDGAVSDLSQYKLTAEELFQRKLDHMSKNHSAFSNHECSNKVETIYDKLTKTRYNNKPKKSDINERKQFLKDALVSDRELYELFKKSEHTLESVESMFGNPAKRYAAKPSITHAPKSFIDSNNSNCHILNDVSDSDSDNKINAVETNLHNADDELMRFRNFIEYERNKDRNLERQLDDKSSNIVTTNSDVIYKDASTQMCEPVNEKSSVLDVLNYMYKSMSDNNGTSDSGLSEDEVNVCNNIMKYIMDREKQNQNQLNQLKEEDRQNKELIDALTLELIKTSEKLKALKLESEKFSKSVAVNLTDIQNILIKSMYDTGGVIKTPVNNQPIKTMLPNSRGEKIKSNEPFNDIEEQLKSLHLERNITQNRLQNLMKIKQSVDKVSNFEE